MEDENIIEEKRAKNMVWAAAENYELEPLFLAFFPDETADMYLNMIIGLSYKWYDWQQLEAFFQMLGGKHEELYEGLLWIGLENALYKKEYKKRSALRELRREYAKACVKRYHRQKTYSRIDQLRNGHCREILGLDTGLKEDALLLREFDFSADSTTEEILNQTREIFERYFSYRPTPVKKKSENLFMQKIAGVVHPLGQISATCVRVKSCEDLNFKQSVTSKLKEYRKHFLFQLSAGENPERALAYVKACFGESILDSSEQAEVEKRLCTGNHKNCHLWFTRGRGMKHPAEDGRGSIVSKYPGSNGKPQHRAPSAGSMQISDRELREILEFRKECKRQWEKNREHFEKNSDLYRNSIRRLSEQLRMTLDTERDPDLSPATHGIICPGRVWQTLYQDNPRIFQRREEIESPGFSVDILMDASSSRKNSQEFIAAQGYVLEKSLESCGIPVQLYSYCSIRGVTIMHVFRTYGENGQDRAIFGYTASGNNRDGLDLRGAGYLMEKSPKVKKLLLVLTDASPQDDQILGEGAFYKNKEYTDDGAAEDTAAEVRAIQRKGITVVGIVMGSSYSIEEARKIFGRDFVKIQNINEFADTVGRILLEKIREL